MKTLKVANVKSWVRFASSVTLSRSLSLFNLQSLLLQNKDNTTHLLEYYRAHLLFSPFLYFQEHKSSYLWSSMASTLKACGVRGWPQTLGRGHGICLWTFWALWPLAMGAVSSSCMWHRLGQWDSHWRHFREWLGKWSLGAGVTEPIEIRPEATGSLGEACLNTNLTETVRGGRWRKTELSP